MTRAISTTTTRDAAVADLSAVYDAKSPFADGGFLLTIEVVPTIAFPLQSA